MIVSIKKDKIRLHDWSVKEHQERRSDLINSGYASRLSSQLEMRSEGHCFLRLILYEIHSHCVLLSSLRCLVPSERKAPLAPRECPVIIILNSNFQPVFMLSGSSFIFCLSLCTCFCVFILVFVEPVFRKHSLSALCEILVWPRASKYIVS